MKKAKIDPKKCFPKSDGWLLAAQNSRSFSCAPRFDHVLIKKPQKIFLILLCILAYE